MIRFADFYIIELTMKCNTQCEYCYLRNDRTPFNDIEMNYDTFKYVIDSIIENYTLNTNPTNKVTIVLHGGEPLLIGYNKLKQFIEYAVTCFNKYNILLSLSIQTNGSLLNQQFIDLFNNNHVAIGISYDIINTHRFHNEEVNNNIAHTIESLTKQNIDFGIISVITNDNIDFVLDYEKQIDKQIKTLPIYNVTNNDDLNLDLVEYFNKIEKPLIDDFEWLKNINELHRNIYRLGLKTISDILIDYVDDCQSTCNFKFCGSGVRIVAFEPDGSISKCDRYDIKYFNKFKLSDKFTYDFLGISQLKKAIDFNYILHDLNITHKCDLCYARGVCEFECQALHYTKYSKFGVTDEICKYTKTVYNYFFDNIYKIIEYAIDNDISIPIIEFIPIEIKYRYHTNIKDLYKYSAKIQNNKIVFTKD